MKVMSLSLHSSRPWRPLFQNWRNVAGNPPPIDELKVFKDDILKMIQLAKFKQVYNPFLNKLKDNTKCIKNETYSSLLTEHRNFIKYVNIQLSIRTNITKSYKKKHSLILHEPSIQKTKHHNWALMNDGRGCRRDRHWRAERPVLKNCRKITETLGKKETCHRRRKEKRTGVEKVCCWWDEMARNR